MSGGFAQAGAARALLPLHQTLDNPHLSFCRHAARQNLERRKHSCAFAAPPDDKNPARFINVYRVQE